MTPDFLHASILMENVIYHSIIIHHDGGRKSGEKISRNVYNFTVTVIALDNYGMKEVLFCKSCFMVILILHGELLPFIQFNTFTV